MYDVIVVGAGPAGASTAYELAPLGLKILILERAKLPRYKACGGAIPMNFFRTMPTRAQKTLESVMRGGWYMGAGIKFGPVQTTEIAGVMRDRFDYEFTLAAVEAGAELMDDNPVVGIEEKKDRVSVKTKKGLLEATFLVGADGATGVTKKCLGIGSPVPPAAALEVEVARVDGRLQSGEFLAHCTLIRDGYSWVFSKGDIHSVGIASFDRDRKKVRQKLAEWAAMCGYNLTGQAVHGHPIPIWRKRIRLSTRRSLLVGDASSTVDPLGGEGIRYGILSGRIASTHIQAALQSGTIPENYDREIYERIHSDFVYARWLATCFYRFPTFFFHMWARTKGGTELMGKVLYGELRYRDLFQKAFRALLRPRAYARLLGQ